MRSRRWVLLGTALLALSVSAEPLVGPAVGNADVLATDGAKLYNRKQYAKAADSLLKATRADPTRVSPYLLLARSYLGAKQLRFACTAYRAYLKAAPDSVDRMKASAELQGCEKRLKRARGQPPDLTQTFVEEKAQVFHALEQNELLGPRGAAETLRTLVHQGYLGVDLADMATKLSQAAVGQAEELFKRSMRHEALSPDALQAAPVLYQLAADTGAPPPSAPGRAAFLDGLGALKAQDFVRAEQRFADAAKSEPQVPEYHFYRAISLYRAGKAQSGLQVLEKELPDDPRTAVLRAAIALDTAPEQGATELEHTLFTRRFDSTK